MPKVIFKAEFSADMPAYAKRWLKAKRMHDAGITYSDIGKAFGVSASQARVLALTAERRIAQWEKNGFPDFWGMGFHTNLPSLATEAAHIANRKPAYVMNAIAKMADGLKERDWIHL